MARTLSEIIESIPVEGNAGPHYLSDRGVVSVRLSLRHRIILGIMSEKVQKKKAGFAAELLEAAIDQVWGSEAFQGEEYDQKYKEECINAGVFLDEFMTPEEQYELFEREALLERQRNIEEGGQENVQA